MSNPNPKTPLGPAVSGTVLIVGIVVVFCFTVAGAVAIAVAVPEGGNPGTLMALLLGAAASAIASIAALAKIANVERGVDRLSNGLSDAKIRTALEQVLAPHLVDPEVLPQLRVDEVVIEAEERRQARRKR